MMCTKSCVVCITRFARKRVQREASVSILNYVLIMFRISEVFFKLKEDIFYKGVIRL